MKMMMVMRKMMRQFHKIKMHDCRLWTAVYIASLAATMTIGDHGSGDDWNSLPAAVRDTPSLLCFCRRLKTSLFQSSFNF